MSNDDNREPEGYRGALRERLIKDKIRTVVFNNQQISACDHCKQRIIKTCDNCGQLYVKNSRYHGEGYEDICKIYFHTRAGFLSYDTIK